MPVIVRDTTGPVASITLPSSVAANVPPTDVLLSTSPTPVTVHATDSVGVTIVTVNGVPATLSSGTPQDGKWSATVPITVGTGVVVPFSAVARDASPGNATEAKLVVDNDGIAAALDRDRTTGDDLSDAFTSDFNNGTTAGTLIRNGWTMKVTSASGPWAGGVRAMIAGSGTGVARVSACVGATKEVRLDVVGEAADIQCDPVTGTITVHAASAVPRVEVWKQVSPTTWTSAQLPTGATYSTGSPATASPDNTEPIDVNVVRVEAGGPAHVVGSFQLAPGASVDLAVTPASGRDEQVRFEVLRGRVPVTLGGRTRDMEPGEPTTLPIDRTPPTIEIRSPRAEAMFTVGQAVAAAFACEDADSGIDTCEGTSASGQPIETATVGAATFAVTATDHAGNAGTASVPYAGDVRHQPARTTRAVSSTAERRRRSRFACWTRVGRIAPPPRST